MKKTLNEVIHQEYLRYMGSKKNLGQSFEEWFKEWEETIRIYANKKGVSPNARVWVLRDETWVYVPDKNEPNEAYERAMGII